MQMTQQDFEEIIRRVAEETPNCDGVDINGTRVTMYWHSNSGNNYAEKYDFNDNGSITGHVLILTMPYPGSTAPGIFENKAIRAIRRFIEG